MFNLSAPDRDPFPPETRAFFLDNLRSADGYRMRQGILRAAEAGSQFEVYHGAAAKSSLYRVDELQSNRHFREHLEIEHADAEKFYGLLCQNFKQILSRFEKAGRPATQQTFVDAMGAALGGPNPDIQAQLEEQNEDVNRWLDQIRADEENKEEIKKLKQKMDEQEEKFNRDLEAQKKETQKAKKEKDRVKSKDPEQHEPAGEGFAALLKQANRYDIKTIAIMGTLQAMCLPFDVLLIFLKDMRKVGPTCPSDWLGVLKLVGSDTLHHVNKHFGFGAREGAPAPAAEKKGKEDDMGVAAAQQAAAPPRPKPNP